MMDWIMGPTGSKNKPRIFLAYYDRAARPGNEPYHVAILVRNHPLEDNPNSAMRFHAVNKIQPPTNECPEAREVWMFESKASWFVTPHLAGLMYLGKLPEGKSTDDVANICASVPVDSTGEGGRRCSHWVWDTLQRLVETNIIPPLPCTSQELYGKGRNYILERRMLDRTKVFCIDTQIAPYDFSC